LTVFAFRVHSHVHADVNAAYRVRGGKEWTELAIGDPQWPQAFYPTKSAHELKQGDMLVGACTYHNFEHEWVFVGPTHQEEMCIVYLMYYTENVNGTMYECFGSVDGELEAKMPYSASIRPSKYGRL
jgi:hypothetical protein